MYNLLFLYYLEYYKEMIEAVSLKILVSKIQLSTYSGLCCERLRFWSVKDKWGIVQILFVSIDM